MASRTEHPDVAFVLPGEWVQVDLSDERQVGAMTNLVDDDPGVGVAPWLAEARALGGVTLLFRIRSEPTVALLFAWPLGWEGSAGSPEKLRNRMGAGAEILDHAAGYACVRSRSSGPGSDGEVLTYGIVHPESGRTLLMRVTAFDGPFDDVDVDTYDMTASETWWEDECLGV